MACCPLDGGCRALTGVASPPSLAQDGPAVAFEETVAAFDACVNKGIQPTRVLVVGALAAFLALKVVQAVCAAGIAGVSGSAACKWIERALQ